MIIEVDVQANELVEIFQVGRRCSKAGVVMKVRGK
jgi:hypothetical protein